MSWEATAKRDRIIRGLIIMDYLRKCRLYLQNFRGQGKRFKVVVSLYPKEMIPERKLYAGSF